MSGITLSRVIPDISDHTDFLSIPKIFFSNQCENIKVQYWNAQMKAIDLELIEEESRQNENSRFLSGITRSSNQINQIFHFTRWITPKRVTRWRGPSLRRCARATQLLSKKSRSGGEPLATLCPIWLAWDLNLRPPAPETNALLLGQPC